MKSTIVGRKAIIQPNTTFYEPGGENVVVILNIVKIGNRTALSCSDGTLRLPIYPHELKYLNNRPVVLP